MSIEDQLRETLWRMAARVRTSDDAWDAIQHRRETRRWSDGARRLAVAVSALGLSAIALALLWGSFRPATRERAAGQPGAGTSRPALEIAARIRLPRAPQALAVSDAGAWVALPSDSSCDGEVVAIDASRDAVAATVPLDVVPTEMAVGGGSVWVGGFRCGEAQGGSFETSAVLLRMLPRACWARSRSVPERSATWG